MEPTGPRICCLDLDTFFVSVERLFDPSLVGRPVVVGALPGQRGVVTAASYEVRVLGVKSGMPIATAYRLAPNAVYLRGRSGSYGGYAKKVKAILERYTPVVRTASIDEFFLDFKHCEAMYRRPDDVDDDGTIERVVREMREAIQVELRLPASAGVAVSRPLAKIASGAAKPAGVCMVRVGEEQAFLAPLPVRRWPGIGPVAERRLLTAGLATLGQLIERNPEAAEGSLGAAIRRAMSGELDTAVDRDRPAFREHDPRGLTVGSISNERTFSADVGDLRAIRDQLRGLSERVCWRARSRDVRARTITLKLRYSDFETLTRSRTIEATTSEREVFDCVRALFRENYKRGRRVRLVGVGLTNLVDQPPQGELFAESEPVGGVIDAVRARFGFDAIHFGASGKRPQRD